MRSRKTNYLQSVILITGVVYLLTGGIFALSPHLFADIFSIEINEDWFKEIPKDPFMFMVISISRSFGLLIFSMGIAMVLPLFDPLRYRGLVYFTGVLFPAGAALICTLSSLTNPLGILIGYAAVFTLISVATIAGLSITRDTVKSGVE